MGALILDLITKAFIFGYAGVLLGTLVYTVWVHRRVPEVLVIFALSLFMGGVLLGVFFLSDIMAARGS